MVISSGEYPAEDPKVPLSPDDTAYIQYTGGTTGAPKGAMLSHRNALSELLIVQHWMMWERGKGVAISGFPFFHIAGLFFNSNVICAGWSQVLVPNPRDTNHIVKEMAKYRPCFMANVPSLYYMLMENPGFKTLDHSCLDICVSAASPFPEESQRKFEDIIGNGKLLEAYGMTETSPLTIMNPATGKKKLGAIGLPLPNLDVRLVDPETGFVVPTGQPGEICVKGPVVMKGYYKKDDETAHAVDAEGYMHTGDVAIQDEEGYLRIVDRTKDMINVSGYKVFSKKVEETLSAHPAIDMIAVIGMDNPERPGVEAVKAVITVRPGYEGGGDESIKEDIIRFSREKLSPFEVPQAVDIRKELPLTSVGKIDKKVLRKEM